MYKDMERLSFIRSCDTQRLSPTGAAAHMSLHLNRQCQRADASPSPFYRGTGLPIDETRTGRAKRPCPAGEKPYMEEISYRQQLFENFLKKLSNRRSLASMAVSPAGEGHMGAAEPAVNTHSSKRSSKVFNDLAGYISSRIRREEAIWDGQARPSTASSTLFPERYPGMLKRGLTRLL
jgi:hypothetical protein